MDFQVFLPIEKVDEEKRMVWGYASTPSKDLQGEIVALDAIKAALPDYMQWRNIREMHTASAVGSAVEAHVDEKGLYLGAKIRDNAAWEKCKESKKGANDQVYRGFSIGGSKLEKVGDEIKALRLTEISLVDRPANPDCKIELVKVADGAPLPVSKPDAQVDNSLIGRFLDICKSLVHPAAAHDGFQLPARVLETPSHAALEGHQPSIIPLRVDNADKHPSNAMQTDLRTPGAQTPKDEEVPLTADELTDLRHKMSTADYGDFCNPDLVKRKFSAKERKHLASTGAAMADGSYPIENEADLKNAVHAYGRSPDEATKNHIISRAKALKLTNLLPADWPGSTKEEKTVMDQDLQKRMAAAHKASLAKAHEHLQKAIACHGKACEAHNNLVKCMGKADGASEHATHLKSLSAALSQMGDHHDIAMHHLSKVNSGWTGESKETPKDGEGGAVTSSNAGTVDLLPQHHLTEGGVAGTSGPGFAGDSPYNAAAVAAEIQKQVAAAVKPLEEKLRAAEIENATIKGGMAVLERLPSAGPRPRLITGTFGSGSDLVASDPKAAVNAEITKAYQSIDPNDPDSAIRSASRIIGLRTLNGAIFGKHITDPDYKGGAGR